jgi:AcrR family transcriptional regulator
VRKPESTAEETSKRVHAAAVKLFAAKGFAATGLRELAGEAKLTPAALYHYMGSKDDLLVEIMRSTIEPLDQAARETVDAIEDPSAKLAALVELHVWVHGSQPKRTLVTDTEVRALHGEQRDYVIGLRDHYEALWRQVLKLGVKGGQFEIAEVRLTATGMLELCTGISHWYQPGGRHDLLDLCAMHADWALGVARAREGDEYVRRADLDLPSPADRFPIES